MNVDCARCIPDAEGDYLIVKRDDMEIHFWKTADRQLPETTSCYIRGGQVGALFEEFERRQVPKLSSFEVRRWNMKEFHVHDRHGNLPRFGCGEWQVLPSSRAKPPPRRRSG
jgi:hypothetical protein